MIKVRVYRSCDNNIVKFIVNGHARYSEEGKDIICAAVSSVAQSAVLGLTQVLGLKVGLEMEDGYLECILPDDMEQKDRENVDIILGTMVLSMKNLETQYKSFLKVIEMEV